MWLRFSAFLTTMTSQLSMDRPFREWPWLDLNLLRLFLNSGCWTCSVYCICSRLVFFSGPALFLDWMFVPWLDLSTAPWPVSCLALCALLTCSSSLSSLAADSIQAHHASLTSFSLVCLTTYSVVSPTSLRWPDHLTSQTHLWIPALCCQTFLGISGSPLTCKNWSALHRPTLFHQECSLILCNKLIWKCIATAKLARLASYPN